MALPDFFTFYGLPQSFHPDPAELRRLYYLKSRQYHPDRFTGDDEAAYDEALEMSALNNEAYRTLSNPDATMGYILTQHGIVDSEEAYQLPPDFLMEMMELNEAADEGGEAAESTWKASIDGWEAEAGSLMAQFDAGKRSPELYAALKEYYFKKKYLMRLGERF